MKRLYFIYQWGKGQRDNSWSGTPYNLFIALKNKTVVVDRPITNGYINKIVEIVAKIYNRVFHTNEFKIFDIKLNEARINKMKIDERIPCIMFCEYLTAVSKDSYVYQDLSVDYVERLRLERPEIVQYTPFPRNVALCEMNKRNAMAKQYYTICRGIFTMSKWLRDDLINHTGVKPEKVHWIGGGCNIDITKVDVSNKTGNRFLFIGKDWERKNGPLVIEAFSRLKKKYADVELYIVGPQKVPVEIERHKNGVFFVGRKSYGELVAYYNMCDYFVMPSKFEAYGLVFAEALIYGLPCIGKNEFAMPEFIIDGKNGYLINEDSASELEQCMEKLVLGGAIMAKGVQNNQKSYIKEYSWDSVASRMLKVIQEDGY